MERLTKNILDPMMLCPVLKTLDDKNAYCQSQHCDCDNCRLGKQLVKLAYYENLKEQGLLLKLPCKVCDTVYKIYDKVYEFKVIAMYFENDNLVMVIENMDLSMSISLSINEVGKYVFLTKEEAEKALAEMEK